jgi:hypothetical protein
LPRSNPPSIAPELPDLTKHRWVRVTHPFHPLAGRDLEFVKRRKSWRQDRVYVFDTAGELVNLPAEWTDVVAPDPFVVASAGRVPFHLAGLIELAEIVGQLRSTPAASVKATSP